MTPADTARSVRLTTALLLIGTFGAGVVAGAGVLRWSARPGFEAPTAVAPPLPAARLPRELNLTPEQEAKAREIGERYRPELEALAKEIRPKVRAVQDRMEAEFLAVLTPGQRQQLSAIEERRRHPPRPDEASLRAAPTRPEDGPPPAPSTRPGDARPKSPQAADDQPAGSDGTALPRRPPPQEAIDACLHLDVDQLCRFTRNGRAHEGSCRRPPPGVEGPISCAPDRALESSPGDDRPR